MNITTDMVIEQLLAGQRQEPSSLPMPVQVAIADLNDSAKFITFCWHGLRRIESASVTFDGWDINVYSMAGRVMITFSKDEESVSYVGAKGGYSCGLNSCSIDHESARVFVKTCESFANAFTPEAFLIDRSLRILP